MQGTATGNRSQATKSDQTRERKRETDRKSQRASRARTKQYVALLEKKTAALQESMAASDHSALTKRLDDQLDENEKLKEAIRKIEQAAKAALGTDQQNLASEVSQIEDETSHRSPSPSKAGTAWPREWQQRLSSLAPNQYYPGVKDRSMNLKCGESDRDYFQVLNEALNMMETIGKNLACPTVELDEDVNIRVVLHGWDATQSKTNMDAGWQILRLVDQGLLFRSPPVERVAMLRIMRSLHLSAHAQNLSPRQLPPSYMNPTFLQANVQHARLIDYFTWPSVRDHLIMNNIEHIPEWMTSQFIMDVGFHFPYELRDVAKCHAMTGRYAFSKEFDEAFQELDSWYVRSSATAVLIPSHKESLDSLLDTELRMTAPNQTTMMGPTTCIPTSNEAGGETHEPQGGNTIGKQSLEVCLDVDLSFSRSNS